MSVGTLVTKLVDLRRRAGISKRSSGWEVGVDANHTERAEEAWPRLAVEGR